MSDSSSGQSEARATERERWEEAVYWRSAAIGKLRSALDATIEAEAACHRLSLERVKIERAVLAAREAFVECDRSLAEARAGLELAVGTNPADGKPRWRTTDGGDA